MKAGNSDEDSEPDYDYAVTDEDDRLRPHTRDLGLSKAYCPTWNRDDAFREFYQNWKDAIISTFSLDPREFRPRLRETAAQIIITVDTILNRGGSAQVEQLLGFIRFHKATGTLELTNFNAQLGLSNLNLGVTDKRDNDNLAGCHGEGFKIAALVMRRRGHSVRFQTGSYYWSFGFHGSGHHSTLRCRLTPAKPETIERQKSAYTTRMKSATFKRGLTSNIWEDMTVRIGKARGGEGISISEASFRSWLQVALDLDRPCPEKMIETKSGDLIIDGRYAGRIYLKGLRVSGGDPNGQDYRYGYNLLTGGISRDRERLMKQRQEAQIVAQIWGEAIEKSDDTFSDLYIHMFERHEKAPDISLAAEYVSALTAETLLKRLKATNPGAFFYSEPEAARPTVITEDDMIVKDFKKTPKKLSKDLWQMLRKHRLVRSPYEERTHLFSSSTPSTLRDDFFTVNILRGLSGAFELHPKLANIKVEFVEGGRTSIDLLFTKDDDTLRIHEKWLSSEWTHADTECDFYQLRKDQVLDGNVFSCFHVVQDLLELALEDIRGPLGVDQEEFAIIRHKAGQRLQQMPSLVALSTTGAADELLVSWVGNESGLISKMYGGEIMYRVTLHTMETCAGKRDDVVYVEDTSRNRGRLARSRKSKTEPCTCPWKVVNSLESRAVFSNLNSAELYFPMVSRVGDSSFFGIPPGPVSPRVSRQKTTLSTEQIRSPKSATATYFDAEPHIDSDYPMSERQEDFGTHPSNATAQYVRPTRASEHASTSGPTASDQLILDEEIWENWHEQELPQLFAKFKPQCQIVTQELETGPSSLEFQPLDFTFETDEYASILTKDDPGSEKIVLVHDLWLETNPSGGSGWHLLVTKYSVFKRTYPFCTIDSLDGDDTGDKELILYFRNPDKMGLREDAELIAVDDIMSASAIEITLDEVKHTMEPVLGTGEFFCRFAIQSGDQNGAWITPLASHLLPRKDRWRRPKFAGLAAPFIYDLSPDTLGPADGFAQEGFTLAAALNFDESRYATWKIRYLSTPLYDGSVASIADDISSGKLRSDALRRQPGAVNVVVVAGGDLCFRLSERNDRMATLAEFLHPLTALNEGNENLECDFVVAMLPPAVLHGSASGKFSASVLNLLEQRMWVNLRLDSLEAHGLPQNRRILTIVASRNCAKLPWDAAERDHDGLATGPRPTIDEVMIDLAFENLRTGTGFACAHPAHLDNGTIHNHRTGQVAATGETAVPLHLGSKFSLVNGPKQWMHPFRRDRLTVREIARIQGIPDDFVFYGSIDDQYKDVCRAVPPVLAKAVARVIRKVTEMPVGIKVEMPFAAPARGYKRPRIDDADEK